LSDNGFGMFRNLLKYKLEDRGKQFIKIDKWYASSKICSNCKNKKDTLKLSDRVYKCDYCGLSIDRDYNASLNIREVGSTLLAW
ncbi:MAG TPA: transposase, partial [Clostridiaceae bacterium]